MNTLYDESESYMGKNSIVDVGPESPWRGLYFTVIMGKDLCHQTRPHVL